MKICRNCGEPSTPLHRCKPSYKELKADLAHVQATGVTLELRNNELEAEVSKQEEKNIELCKDIAELEAELANSKAESKELGEMCKAYQAELAQHEWVSVDGWSGPPTDYWGCCANMWPMWMGIVRTWSKKDGFFLEDGTELNITHIKPITLPEEKELDCKFAVRKMTGKVLMVLCQCDRKSEYDSTVCGETSYKECRYGEPKKGGE